MAKIADVQEVSLELLRPYERNAKKHGREQIEKLKNSIIEFGFLTPCLIDRDYNIIAGHGRVMAAKDLGLESVPCVFIEGLTEAQRKAYILADNRLGELGEWDMELVWDELAELDNLGFDVELTGFDMPEELPEVIEDDFDESAVPDEPRTKLGDLYQLGQHRLICGDSTDASVIDRLMDGVKADMVFTDPPYGMKKESEGVLNDNLNYDNLLDFNRQWIPLTFGALKDNGSWYCWGIDEPLMDIYSNILKPMAKENKITFRNLITWDKGNGQGQLSESFRMYPIADEKCLFVMMGTQGFAETSDNMEWCKPIVEKIVAKAKSHGLTPKKMKEIIGHSTNSPDHFLNYALFRFPQKEYYEAWFHDGEYDELKREYDELKREYDELKRDFYDERAYFDNTHDNINNVWHFNRTSESERERTGGHATPKPIALCSRAIKSSSREGEIVLDVFGGSGSTLIACEQLNRKCYMCELDEHYCDVIINRWETLTGREAVLING